MNPQYPTGPALGGAALGELIAGLTQRRLDLRVTQETLASQLGVRLLTVADWEHGRRMPRIAHLLRWHAALDLRLASLPMTEQKSLNWPYPATDR